jgi:hypothetical protein
MKYYLKDIEKKLILLRERKPLSEIAFLEELGNGIR